jgi:hypothetical protein
MDYIFFQVTAVNGFDGISHYLRAALLANLCSAYATSPTPGCSANYTSASGASSAGFQPTGDKSLDKLHAALANGGRAPKAAPKAGKGNATADPFATLRALTNPRVNQQRRGALGNVTGGGKPPQSAQLGPKSAQDQALDYLLGSGP